jgi:hypothetical protein
MCSEDIADEHQHVVNLEGRQLMCVCRGCYLLFTDTEAELRFRAIPDRYLSFPDFALDRRQWEALQIPVGLAFFFRNSALGRTVAFYPGPAGATESELDLQAWTDIRHRRPRRHHGCRTQRHCWYGYPMMKPRLRMPIWSRSMLATSSSAGCA